MRARCEYSYQWRARDVDIIVSFKFRIDILSPTKMQWLFRRYVQSPGDRGEKWRAQPIELRRSTASDERTADSCIRIARCRGSSRPIRRDKWRAQDRSSILGEIRIFPPAPENRRIYRSATLPTVKNFFAFRTISREGKSISLDIKFATVVCARDKRRQIRQLENRTTREFGRSRMRDRGIFGVLDAEKLSFFRTGLAARTARRRPRVRLSISPIRFSRGG